MSPSPRRSTLAGLILHYRLTIPRDAAAALEDRDAAWRTQNDALLSDLHSLTEDRTMQEDQLEGLRRRNRVLEEESVQMERAFEVLEKERGDFEYECGRLEAKRGEEVARVSDLLRRNHDLEEEVNVLRGGSLMEAESEDGAVVAVVKGLEERASLLAQRNYVLEKEIGEMRAVNERILDEKARKEADLKDMCELVDKIMVLEREKRRAVEEENSKLIDRIGVLEGDMAVMEAEAEMARRDRSREYDREEKHKLRAEEAEKRVSRHLKTIKSLERKIEAKVLKVERKKSKKIDRIVDEKKRLVEEKNDRISELARRAWNLEREKAEMDAQVVKANKDRSDAFAMVVELERALKEASEATVLEEEKRRAIECQLKEENSKLANKIEVLEEEKRALEMEKEALEAKVLEEEERRATEGQLNEENSKLVDRIEALERDRGAMEVEVSKKEMERKCVALRMHNVKKTLEEEKRRLEEEVAEMTKRIVVMEREKAGMDDEVQKVERDKCNESYRVVELNKALEAQTLRAEDAEKLVLTHLKTIRVLDAEKGRLEEQMNKMNSDLLKRIEILEREKAELESEVCKGYKDNTTISYKIVELKKALEAQKRRTEEAISLNTKREKRKEIERILSGKKTMEQGGTKKIEGEKKKEMEAKFCRADKEKSEEIQTILNKIPAMEAEKRAMKDAYEKKNLELADQISILEVKSQGFEAQITEKNHVIKVLYKENMSLEDAKTELETKLAAAMSEQDVQLLQSVHPKYNNGTVSTSWQNEGQKSAGVLSPSEHNESINHDVENSVGQSEDGMTRTNACKRKRSIIKCEQLGIKILKPAGEQLSTSNSLRPPALVDEKPVLVPREENSETKSTTRMNGSRGRYPVGACRWEADQDLLEAFDVDPELCLKAVCALYRQHTQLTDSENTSPSAGVLKPEYSLRAITFGEYLTTEDPECRKMKKMVGKLNKLDVKAIGMCKEIAKQHYKRVFEMYKNEEDPLFLS